MSEQQPEAQAQAEEKGMSALDRPETDALDEAADNPGMNYGDPTVEGISDEALEDHSTGGSGS